MKNNKFLTEVDVHLLKFSVVFLEVIFLIFSQTKVRWKHYYEIIAIENNNIIDMKNRKNSWL